MLLKGSLIAILFAAVFIDKSFEKPEILECDSPEQCLNQVKSHHLNEGVVPILISHVIGNIAAEKDIINFIRDQEFTKILKINVAYGKNSELAKYLHRDKRCAEFVGYPIVIALNDDRVVRHIVRGYDHDALTEVFNIAMEPDTKDYIPKHNLFTYDLKKMIDKKNELGMLDQDETAGTFELPEQPQLDLTLGISGYQTNDKWTLDLNKQPNMLADSNPHRNRKRSRSRSTPEQTGPGQKKRKGKNILHTG